MSYLKPPQLPAPAARLMLVERHGRRIDDHGARLPHLVERRGEHLHDLRIRRVALVGLAQHADARAFQAIAFQRPRVVGNGLRPIRRAETAPAADRQS